MAPNGAYELLTLDDPAISPSRDPERARRRLEEARWSDATCDVTRARILELLDSCGAAIAERSNREFHLTGSALVVDSEIQHALVILHAKLGRWLQPGGHADGDHELAGVALREATEETGIEGLRVLTPAVDVDIHTIPARGAEPEHLHLDLRFAVLAPQGAQPSPNHESLGIRWVSLDELAKISEDAGLLRLATAALNTLRSIGGV